MIFDKAKPARPTYHKWLIFPPENGSSSAKRKDRIVRICMNLICTVVPMLSIPLSEFNEFILEQTAEWFYFCRSTFWNVTFMCYSGKWVGGCGGSPRPVKILSLISSTRDLNSNWLILPKLTEMEPTNISGYVLSHHWCEAFCAEDWDGWRGGVRGRGGQDLVVACVCV